MKAKRYFGKQIIGVNTHHKTQVDREAVVEKIFAGLRDVILWDEMCERVRKLVREREKSRQSLPKSGHQAVKDGRTKYKGIGKDGKRKRL